MLNLKPDGLPKPCRKYMRELLNTMIGVDQEVMRLNRELQNMQKKTQLAEIERVNEPSARVERNRRQSNEDLAAYARAWSIWQM